MGAPPYSAPLDGGSCASFAEPASRSASKVSMPVVRSAVSTAWA
jgi:hypothetical protein